MALARACDTPARQALARRQKEDLMARPGRAVPALVTFAALAALPAHAQWSPDPNVNNAVFAGLDTQAPVVAVSDGTGGAIFVWRTARDLGGGNFAYDLLAQRVNATGAVQWPAAGVTLVSGNVSALSTLLSPAFSAVADGNGGAIAAWRDVRTDTGDIFVARVTAAGTVPWTAGGVGIGVAVGLQQRPALISDGAGGAIVTWQDRRSGNTDVFAQRVTAAGAGAWTANGVPVCAATGEQLLPAITGDGASGAIVAWADSRGLDVDVYAQRLSSTGVAQWTADGVALVTATGGQTRPSIVGDGASGAIVAWEDTRNAFDNDVYARRISAAGAPQWTGDGVAVANTANASFPFAVTDGAGGVVIAWTDERNGGGNTDVFAQRLNAAGAPQWAANGVSVCAATGGQFFPAAVSDGLGGIIVGWEDSRGGTPDVFAQRISSAGAPLWNADGRPVSTPANGQTGVSVATDGASGGIFGWSDARTDGGDVYAAHVNAAGALPVTLEHFTIE
jgi:hypothetical protein